MQKQLMPRGKTAAAEAAFGNQLFYFFGYRSCSPGIKIICIVNANYQSHP